ncbi:serine/threonine-protein kinase PCRK1-like protein [Tanacetum coccineum]
MNQQNTQGDNFHSDSPDSDIRPPIPQSIRNKWSDSDTPTPNVRPSSLRVFTFWELKKATTNFKVSPEIADSGFGRVHIGIIKSLEHPFDDIHVAVKRVKRGQKASLS